MPNEVTIPVKDFHETRVGASLHGVSLRAGYDGLWWVDQCVEMRPRSAENLARVLREAAREVRRLERARRRYLRRPIRAFFAVTTPLRLWRCVTYEVRGELATPDGRRWFGRIFQIGPVYVQVGPEPAWRRR